MTGIAIACGTTLAAETGAAVLDAGGRAADAAVAATFMTWVCEPGLTSPACGAFASVWPADGEPITIDGFVEMPGRSAPADRFGHAERSVMDYGGETHTIIGPGSIGTPGGIACLARLWSRWGRVPWAELIAPAVAAARDGFPLPAVSHRYMQISREAVFARTPDALAIPVRPDGTDRDVDELVQMPDLAASLQAIADDGQDAFYRGDLARVMSDWIVDNGGLLGRDDLDAYEAIERPCLRYKHGDWALATNPPPAVGGITVIELLELMGDFPTGAWDEASVDHFARAMELALSDRRQLLLEADITTAALTLLSDGLRDRRRLMKSPSTSHAAVVDKNGLAVSITTSTGYTSGVIVPGTGILQNNVLGEIELFPGGLHSSEPGTRLRSNMAPSVARSRKGDVIAFGAAGADRIASALAQVWLNCANLGMPLRDAVDAPRCHMEWRHDTPVLVYEPGVPASEVGFASRAFEERHMFFGGVQAAAMQADGRLVGAGDPRRGGGTVTR